MLAFVGTALTVTVMAQEKPLQLLRYGVKAGAQLSTIQMGGDTSFPIEIKPLVGYQLGGFATLGLGGDFSLQTELFFSSQGFKEAMMIAAGGGTEEERIVRYSVRYVKLPLLLRYGVAENFFIEAGPQFGVFVSSNIEKADWDIYRKFDLAGAVGAEYVISDKLSAQFRYAHSFAKIDNMENRLWVPERPRVFSLGLAVNLL